MVQLHYMCFATRVAKSPVWRHVLVELVDEFGIDPKLGEILQTPITQVLDGTTLKTFLLQCGSKMIQSLPTRFIDGGRVCLQDEAKYAVSNILPQVRNAMVVFRLGTDYGFIGCSPLWLLLSHRFIWIYFDGHDLNGGAF